VAERVRVREIDDDEGNRLLRRIVRRGRPPTFTLPQHVEIKKIAKAKPAEHGLPFSRWSLTKLADCLVAEGVVEDISHEGLRELLRAESVSFKP
jgi:transposase